ncbi:MAG: hypothetical protein PSV40_15695 [Polaromonas sp.]|uniref:hypothetical protein n=1 Tax=Polaromonas sp. TaxID=1869339 RepID=UPI00248978BC|nr:hypothetical protein [Polaromonas sp.]MDI1270531.1 hypothetical protein [Polaromonas sp.]
MKLRRSLLIAVPLLLLAAVAGANYFFLQRHLTRVLDADPRNKGVEAVVHYKFFVLPSTLVFDLRAVSPTNSPIDVARVLLQFAQTQKEQAFTLVQLAHKGTEKFQLDGSYFRTLGQEYGTQNPVYTMRTLAENVRHLDGSSAFGTWTGGLLGVMGKQMEDFRRFHEQWYIDDLTKTDG